MAIVKWRARKRTAVLRQLWPDVVDHLRSAIRAGLSLPEALIQLGDKGPEELRHVFRDFGSDYRAGGQFDPSLTRLKDRLADPVADRIVEALRLTREVGGSDLGRLLGTLAEFLRESARTRSELEARQSWTVNAARLAVAAPWIVLVLLASRPEAVAAYNTPARGRRPAGRAGGLPGLLCRHAAHWSAAGRSSGCSDDRADGGGRGCAASSSAAGALAVARQAAVHAADHLRRTHRPAAEVPQPGIPAPAGRAGKHHSVRAAGTDSAPGHRRRRHVAGAAQPRLLGPEPQAGQGRERQVRRRTSGQNSFSGARAALSRRSAPSCLRRGRAVQPRPRRRGWCLAARPVASCCGTTCWAPRSGSAKRA